MSRTQSLHCAQTLAALLVGTDTAPQGCDERCKQGSVGVRWAEGASEPDTLALVLEG